MTGPPTTDVLPRRRILLVEDEETLVITLGDRLASEGFEVDDARDGAAGFEKASRDRYDLVILDVSLPLRNGLDVLRDLRVRGIETPVLMLTARAQVTDKVVGLKLGADDYLTKPFEMMELLARVESLLRRSRGTNLDALESWSFGEVRVDFRRAEVQRKGVPIDLSSLELKLLRYFIEHRGVLLTRDELLDKVWGYDVTPVTRTVDVHVASLRQKLESDPSRPRFIVTVHGMGYKWNDGN
ncbi:MAG: response regulator transcription factor [Thermoanaerobaculia bacterium]